ncbi:winged helix-turn-helix transcriptional regulator [Streptomyces sp. MP131-18]|uniref:winged helix-turn-helix transcriptional regulator n=1 Tax=Streptomyces sp. MP131-18 TaxID=1857892 RepID=UPI00209BB419|nr:winged helix-turn-helix transcriptional regulator [Streptomyces sp. MP131-18]
MSWAVYRCILNRGRTEVDAVPEQLGLSVPSFNECLERLLRLRLLHRDAKGRLVAGRPDAVAANIVGPLEKQIMEFRDEAERLNDDLHRLMSMYRRHREQHMRHGSDTIGMIPEGVGINLLVSEIAEGNVRKVLLLHAGTDGFGGLLNQVLAETASLSERGVRVRAVCAAEVLDDDSAAWRCASTAARAGALVRVVPQVAGSLVILDGHAAFIPAAGGQAGSAVVVRQTTVLDMLRDAFEQHWPEASSLEKEAELDAEALTNDEVKRRILRLLVQGARDGVIARRVGISVRTCRRHIAELVEQVGAESRLQAGFLMAGRD